jgi:predicted transcriptional regulator
MNVLLSIKPKYVDEILSGAKKYEWQEKQLGASISHSSFLFNLFLLSII